MRFRFTIRDLLWLTAFVAVLVTWWLDHLLWREQWAIDFNRVEESYRQVNDLVGEVNVLKGENQELKEKLQKSTSSTQP
jgi:hypothetical protein